MEQKNVSFHNQDEMGIFAEGEKLPYFCIKLTKEQVELVKGKKIGIYEIEDRQLFELREREGAKTGEMVFYVVFV